MRGATMTGMRITLGLAVAAAAGSGCAQIAGIAETSAPSTASVDLQRVSVGASVVTSPLELAAPPTFLLAAGNLDGTPGAAGHWSAPAPLAENPAVLYTAPDQPKAFQHELAFATRATRAGFIAFEHPMPAPAPASSLMVDVTLPGIYSATQTLEIAAIGAWTHLVLAGAELPLAGAMAISTTIPYASFTATTASPRARISSMDRVVVLRYMGQTLTGSLEVPVFDQSDATDTLTGTMTAVTADTPFDAAVDPPTVASRYAAIQPAMSVPAMTWRVTASPGASVGATNGVGLAGGAVAMADTSISSSYSDPFASWPAVLTYTTAASRTYTLGGAPVTLSASLSSSLDPAAGLTLDLPAGLATGTSIAQTALITDGMPVSLDPTQPVAVDLTTDKAANSWYAIRIDEFTVVGASVSRTPVIEVLGPTPHLTLPPRVLQAGHTYTVVATCIAGGNPAAASGDLETFAFPISIGQVDSAVFTVVAS